MIILYLTNTFLEIKNPHPCQQRPDPLSVPPVRRDHQRAPPVRIFRVNRRIAPLLVQQQLDHHGLARLRGVVQHRAAVVVRVRRRVRGGRRGHLGRGPEERGGLAAAAEQCGQAERSAAEGVPGELLLGA